MYIHEFDRAVQKTKPRSCIDTDQLHELMNRSNPLQTLIHGLYTWSSMYTNSEQGHNPNRYLSRLVSQLTAILLINKYPGICRSKYWPSHPTPVNSQWGQSWHRQLQLHHNHQPSNHPASHVLEMVGRLGCVEGGCGGGG